MPPTTSGAKLGLSPGHILMARNLRFCLAPAGFVGTRETAEHPAFCYRRCPQVFSDSREALPPDPGGGEESEANDPSGPVVSQTSDTGASDAAPVASADESHPSPGAAGAEAASATSVVVADEGSSGSGDSETRRHRRHAPADPGRREAWDPPPPASGDGTGSRAARGTDSVDGRRDTSNDSLNLSLGWEGFVLEDVELRRDFMAQLLGLPVDVPTAFVQRAVLHLPWYTLMLG